MASETATTTQNNVLKKFIATPRQGPLGDRAEAG
jgi:hypothetical protein